MTLVELLFGSKITKVLGWIAEEASMEGTSEAFRKAELMTRGIARFIMLFGDPASDIALNNFVRKLQVCIDSEDARRAAKRAYKSYYEEMKGE